jgi:hypothetical protein
MFKEIVFTVLFIVVSFYGTAQNDINSYKYIIVPKKYDFSKSEDEYQLNSLTKFLFNKYGYEAYFVDDDFPEDLKKNRCLALTSKVSNEKNTMFKTKLEFILKDCSGVVVMTSQLGESRLKKYKKAYSEALRAAFKTFQNLNYEYLPEEAKLEIAEKESIKQVDNQAGELENIEVLEAASVIGTSATKQVAISQNRDVVYYAQAIDNGFQLVNSEPKIVMKLLTTAAENVFIVKGKSAIVFKEGGLWYYSENEGKMGGKQLLNIKF